MCKRWLIGNCCQRSCRDYLYRVFFHQHNLCSLTCTFWCWFLSTCRWWRCSDDASYFIIAFLAFPFAIMFVFIIIQLLICMLHNVHSSSKNAFCDIKVVEGNAFVNAPDVLRCLSGEIVPEFDTWSRNVLPVALYRIVEQSRACAFCIRSNRDDL